MEVILLEKVHKLGALGDRVNVKPGFGRNYLIPSGKAVSATADNIAKFDARRAELEKQEQDALNEANARAEKLNATSVSIARKAGDEVDKPTVTFCLSWFDLRFGACGDGRRSRDMRL